MNESRKEGKDRKDVDLGNDEKFGWVHIIPVAKFMSWRIVQTDENVKRRAEFTKDGFYLFGFALLDQGIEDDDMFALKEDV
jgi:hypothetical protein